MIKLETKNGIVELPTLLSVTDVRRYLRIRSQTAYDLFIDSSLPSKRIGKSQYVAEDDFRKYLERD